MSKTTFLEFEQPIAELEAKIEELRYVQDESALDISEEIDRLQKKSQALMKDIYAKLTPWQVAQLARHPQRPYTLVYGRHVDPRRPGALQRPERAGARAPEGARYQGAHAAQLRHEQAGGLSQGAPPDATGGKIRPAAIH